MPVAGGLFNALAALDQIDVAFGTLFGVALIWTALKLVDFGKAKAAGSIAGGDRGKRSQRPSVVGSQTSIQVQNSTNSKTPDQVGTGSF